VESGCFLLASTRQTNQNPIAVELARLIDG
jgi:hypothetical protein